MKRQQPKSSPPQIGKRDTGYITETRHYKIITPLYGGGVETQEADPISVVRASEVRGHLRFWWRATRGGQFSTIDDLAGHEGKLWGDTKRASQVTVTIHAPSLKEVETDVAFKVVQGVDKDGNPRPKTDTSKNIAPYAAFPLQPDKDEQKQIGWQSEAVILDTEFTLEIRFPSSHEDEIYEALWAWETFGGIGARTRRGFGALQCTRIGKREMLPVQSKEVKKNIRDHLRMMEDGQWPKGVPHLSSKLLFEITDKQFSVNGAWQTLIAKLQKFRQYRYKKAQGLSLWPEANAIREHFNKDARWPDDNTSDVVINKFPRAVFGLPIPFHMSHDKGLPENITLQGVEKNETEKFDRLASPLILRPIACADGAVGLAAILEWEPLYEGDERYTPPGGLILKGARKDPPVESKLNVDEALNIPPLEGETNVLMAFLKFLMKE